MKPKIRGTLAERQRPENRERYLKSYIPENQGATEIDT
jgi:hypothetical protein